VRKVGGEVPGADAMSIPDKVAAATRINDFLTGVVSNSGLRVKYRITVDPPFPEERDWERPEILVEFTGPDSSLLLERGGELLRALELLALEMLRLPGNEHEKVCFDCMNRRSMRLEELRMAASVAAEKVRKSGAPYQFAPMSSRERRILHLALREETDLRTESAGEGLRRCVVVYPKEYRSANRLAPRSIS
jgi:spoIIIJ-associated protein